MLKWSLVWRRSYFFPQGYDTVRHITNQGRRQALDKHSDLESHIIFSKVVSIVLNILEQWVRSLRNKLSLAKMACEFNLNFLKELEREAVLEVLYRDQVVRKTEEERVRYLTLPFSCISDLLLFFFFSSGVLFFLLADLPDVFLLLFVVNTKFLFFGKIRGYPESLGFTTLLTTLH